MSVLIKGMEKPNHCMSCPMCNGDDDCVLQDCKDFGTWEDQMKGCPLVELPERRGTREEPTPYHVKIGCLYRHYKGGLYRVTAIATETETEEMFVIYVGVKTGKTWARSMSMFCEMVGDVQRFTEVKK